MSSFGKFFRVTTFGESHCRGVGCIVDGVPPRMHLTEKDIQPQLTRRRPGQSNITTPRNEKDKVNIFSGTEFGITLGTPIGMVVFNKDHKPGDYSNMIDIPRPSHADYTYQMKYGVRASSGGGRSSARETIGRVASGAIAEKWLKEKYGITIVAWVSQIHNIQASKDLETKNLTREEIDRNIVRCPDENVSEKMIELIKKVKAESDSVGGMVTCVAKNVPAGLGEPCFDKIEALLAHAMLSIPATKGFEIGEGFNNLCMKGSEHNDMFYKKEDNTIGTKTNRSGGIQGGITNGENIVFRVLFKPPATIGKAQKTCSFDGTNTVLAARGRHDPCVVPRAVPIVEAMCALVLADCCLQQGARLAASDAYSTLGRVRPSTVTNIALKSSSDDASKRKVEVTQDAEVSTKKQKN